MTFLEFTRQLRGYTIRNKKGTEIFKYQLYWNGYSIPYIKENFNITLRD